MYGKRILHGLLLLLLSVYNAPLLANESETSTTGQTEIIEHIGDGYIIYVDRMELNGDESLMDILMICPEFLSQDGKTILNNYGLFIDGLNINIDTEGFLYHTKARDITTITIFSASVVMNGDDELEGEIDISFKDDAAASQAVLMASTYGCAELYSDLTYHSKDRRFTLTGTVVGDLNYQKLQSQNSHIAEHEAKDNIRLAAKWAMTERDSLQLILTQNFTYRRLRGTNAESVIPNYYRNLSFIGAYLHDLNDEEASLYVETNLKHSNSDGVNNNLNDTQAAALLECYLPLLDNALGVTLGTEHNYTNSSLKGIHKEEMLYNDLYVQVELSLGRWQVALGDRFRMMTFWHKPYTTANQEQMWNYSRCQNGLLASLECDLGKGHYLQGVFAQRYYTPRATTFARLNILNNKWWYDTSFKTMTAYVSELKYTYQRKNLMLMGTIENNNFKNVTEDLALRSMQCINTSLWWHLGSLSLTLGASYFHGYLGKEGHNNYLQMKVMPSVMLSRKTRLSSTLLYLGKDRLNEFTPNTYWNIRLSHSISRYVNLFADYHDIAGQKTGNRSLIVGTNIRL
ncbi:MAG: hypothetical protein K6F89_09090 [Prevotella sp.]|nr:hypothetical protein [Prevotella sp.]